MNRSFVWLMSASRLFAILGGGKAPASWRRDVTQRIKVLTAVRRGGAWVEEFRVIYPKLCESPLLGTTLPMLTGSANQTREIEPKIVRPGKKFALWEKSLEHNRNKTTANASTSSPFQPKASNHYAIAKHKEPEEIPVGYSAATLSQLQTQADRSLLSRLAGNVATFEQTEQAHVRSLPIMEKSHKETSFPSSYRDPVAQQEWLNCLVQKAGKAITQKHLDTTGIVKSVQSDTRIPGQSPTLQDQWAMELNGTCASLDLLNRLVQDFFPYDESGSGVAPHPVSNNLHSVKKADESLQRVDKHDGWHGGLASGNSKLEHEASPTVKAQADSTFFGLESNINESAGFSVDEMKSFTPIFPPNVTSSLPDLIAPQQVDAPLPPVTAAISRRGSYEEGKVTENLDMLAEKIKQILDEQARRHGIDV